MPEMPTLDIAGLTAFITLILIALAVFWGIHKAIHIAKN
jgi:hypothetical protein